MPRFVLGVGFLCVVFFAESSYARRVYFDNNYDATTRASVFTRLMPTRGGLAPVEVELHLNALDIDEDSDGLHRLSCEGLYKSAAPGEPDLASSGVLFAVPEGFRAKAEIVSEKEESVSDVYVAPATAKSRCPGQRAAAPAFNEALYLSNAAYPAEKVNVEELGSLQGLKLVRVGIAPIQARLAERSLKVTTDLKLRVSFEPITRGEVKSIELSPAFYDIAMANAANREDVAHYLTRASGELMVMVVADALKGGVSTLVKWLAYKGIQVRVLTVSEAGGTKERIKATLQSLYNSSNPKPSYLMLVGNERSAPAWMEKVKFDNQTAVTDYPYSLLSGTDIIPDILYGRLVADNATELKVQVDRLIQYEAFPERGAGWYAGALTAASREGTNPGDKDYALSIGKVLKSYGYRQVDGLFEGDGALTFKNVNAALAQGRSWVSYFGHGDGTSWQSANDKVSVREIATLQNYGRHPVVFDVACMNADYVRHKPCFGKTWMTAGSGGKYSGAVAYYGGSVSISWHPPAIMSVGIAKSHFEKSLPSVGASVLGGQLYLIQQVGANQDAKDNLTWYNLFGNPAMHLRTSTPKAYQVKTQASNTGNRVAVLVQATDSGGRGMPGLRASALDSTGMKMLDAGVTDSYGRVTVTVDKAQVKGLSISTTGYNAESYKVNVTR